MMETASGGRDGEPKSRGVGGNQTGGGSPSVFRWRPPGMVRGEILGRRPKTFMKHPASRQVITTAATPTRKQYKGP
jgi:hypothetical protein